MADLPVTIPAQRIVIYMPTWLGDCVMATPTLRAIRQLYPEARITGLVKSPMKPILDQLPWLDRLMTVRSRKPHLATNGRRGTCAATARVKSEQFDLAILLPNSFRSALTVWLAGVPRRLGYERDWRGVWLTDQLKPLRQGLGFKPDPTLNYYLKIAEHLGASDLDPTMKLFTRPSDDQCAASLLAKAGHDVNAGKLLIILNPGANKIEKRWHPAKFGELADRLASQLNASIAVTGAPREREVIQAVISSASCPMINLLDHGMNLRLLKSIVKWSGLMVTNDTGPRHIAAAMNVPVVTLFGPTPPEWTTLNYACERELYATSGDVNDLEVTKVHSAVDEVLHLAETAS